MPEQSVEHEPSKTAMGTASLRALAAVDEAVKGPDNLAEIFLTETRRQALKHPALAKPAFSRHIIPGMYEFLIARTAFFDALFERALREGTPQAVFLGAGYDTRPYRFKDLIEESRIFELDARPTQQRKLEILKANGISIPPELAFVPINFNTENFMENLAEAGFDRGRRTLFIWEGVSYYLPEEVVDETLILIRSCPGSSVAFDYSYYSPENLRDEKVGRMRDMHKAKYEGEPVRFGVREGGIVGFMEARGYEICKHFTADEMQRKYLGYPGAPGEKIPAIFCLVHARVR